VAAKQLPTVMRKYHQEGGMPGLFDGWFGFYAVWYADQI
jgi:hypothetical protein